MAFAYPEGECFFQRSSLVNSFFSAEKAEHFYGYMLVEYLWNQPAYQGNSNVYSSYRIKSSKASFGDPRVGYYDQLPIMYGPAYNDIRRYWQHTLCSSVTRLQARKNGAAAEVGHCPCISRPTPLTNTW